jgi:hypothetical protein
MVPYSASFRGTPPAASSEGVQLLTIQVRNRVTKKVIHSKMVVVARPGRKRLKTLNPVNRSSLR